MESAINYLAIAGGIELITEQAEQALNISASVDDLWQSIFVDLSGPWVAVNFIASFLLAYAFIALLLKIFLGVMTEQWSDVVAEFVYLLILVFLLSNNARPVADLALFVRNFTNERVQQIYDINLATVTVESAIKDVLITGDIKSEISNRFETCESKTGTLQIKCLREVGEDARDLIAEAQSVSGASKGLSQMEERILLLLNSLANPTILAQEEARESNAVTLNAIVQSSSVRTIRVLLKAIQFALVSMIELARLLTGLVGPIFIALSTIPGKPRLIESWLTGMIALSALTWSYVVLVGFAASVISIAGAQDTTELGFLVLLAFGSPVVAYALSKGGGESLVLAISTSGLTISRLFYSLF